ncbi:AAA family ATPase [Isoalcanivorax beigongshangi]|uniref:ATP/GTP-binding protein n=1 Tax=Isoalcanivorax beigongshangi TaxID=3238810 RepID=A0ABV4AIV8_9GAMM
MLIEFSVKNFRSIRERQTLSLVRGTGQELVDSNSFKSNTVNDIELLRSAAIYGPNAGGKSNFLLAVRAMKEIVVKSARTQRGDSLPVVPYRLNSETAQAPTEFEIVFIVDGVRYQYGFSAKEDRVYDEWLFAFPSGRPQRWFERFWVVDDQEYDWSFGSFLVGSKKTWMRSTRDNALFLSTAVQLNSQQLIPIYDWFRYVLRTGQVGGWGAEFTGSQCEGDQKERILQFLQAADLGISDVKVESRPFDSSLLPKELSEAFKEEVIEKISAADYKEYKVLRSTDSGDLLEFDLRDDESDGTETIFGFAGPWLDCLDNGYVLFVDELHNSLHPKLVKFLVSLFHDSSVNKNNAQLIFTTHETSILSQDVFRRDQIWFCSKEGGRETYLYPLSDFSPRKGRENLELTYLSGKYGAVPFVQGLK